MIAIATLILLLMSYSDVECTNTTTNSDINVSLTHTQVYGLCTVLLASLQYLGTHACRVTLYL